MKRKVKKTKRDGRVSEKHPLLENKRESGKHLGSHRGFRKKGLK